MKAQKGFVVFTFGKWISCHLNCFGKVTESQVKFVYLLVSWLVAESEVFNLPEPIKFVQLVSSDNGVNSFIEIYNWLCNVITDPFKQVRYHQYGYYCKNWHGEDKGSYGCATHVFFNLVKVLSYFGFRHDHHNLVVLKLIHRFIFEQVLQLNLKFVLNEQKFMQGLSSIVLLSQNAANSNLLWRKLHSFRICILTLIHVFCELIQLHVFYVIYLKNLKVSRLDLIFFVKFNSCKKVLLGHFNKLRSVIKIVVKNHVTYKVIFIKLIELLYKRLVFFCFWKLIQAIRAIKCLSITAPKWNAICYAQGSRNIGVNVWESRPRLLVSLTVPYSASGIIVVGSLIIKFIIRYTLQICFSEKLILHAFVFCFTLHTWKQVVLVDVIWIDTHNARLKSNIIY